MTKAKVETYDIRPFLKAVGLDDISVRWPSRNDVLAIAMRAEREPSANIYGILLEMLCGIPRPTARRAVMAYPFEAGIFFIGTFQQMRARLPAGDPRLSERLPAVLAGAA